MFKGAPRPVSTAAWLFFLAGVLVIVGAIIGIVLIVVGGGSAFIGYVIGSALIPCVLAALLIGFSFPMARGKNSARITVTVAAGLSLLLTLLALAQGGVGVGLFAAIMMVVGIVFAYQRESNDYFRRSPAPPAARW